MKNISKSEELFPLIGERKETKDLKEIISSYTKYWYIFIIFISINIGIAYIYMLYNKTSQYTVASRILIKNDKNGTDKSTQEAFNDLSAFKTTKSIENEVIILSSKSLMNRVVNDLKLFTNFYIKDKFQDIEIYGEEVPIKVDIHNLNPSGYNTQISIQIKDNSTYDLIENEEKVVTYKFGQQISKSYANFTVTLNKAAFNNTENIKQPIQVLFKDIQSVANQYHNSLNLDQINDNASVLDLSITDPKPERAKHIINKLVELYDKEAIEDKNKIIKNTLDFIDERITYLTSEISGVEKNVENYKSKNEVTNISEQASSNLELATDYNKKLSDWEIQTDILKSIESYITKSNGKYKIVPSNMGIEDATLTNLISSYNELQLERERLLRTANPESPLIQNINEQLSVLRSNILENLLNIKKRIKVTSNKLREASTQFRTKVKNAPSLERELLEINRQQSIKQNLYLYLLQKREELSLSLASSSSNIRVLDPAAVEGFKTLPVSNTIYLIAILLGLGIPFSGIYIKNILKNKVHTKQDITALTNTPILGELCHNDSTDPLIVKKGSRTPIVELFRLIRAKMQFVAIDKENKVILITSSMSGEGKTFFAANIGASLAQADKKVLLIDLDLRSPNLSKILGTSSSIGISNYITSKDISIHDIIKTSENETNLFTISSGPIPPDPAEMIMSQKLAKLITDLKDRFDHIIIDSAPVGQVADALSLSHLLDSTIFIVRSETTYKEQIKDIDNFYLNREFPHPMIVLNDLKEDKHVWVWVWVWVWK